MLNCNYLPTFEDFSVLCHVNKNYLLELKESFHTMRYRPSMNRYIRSALLYLFDWVFVTLIAALCGLLWSVFQSKAKLKILIISMWNGLIINRRNLFETCHHWFLKNWICRKKLLSLYKIKIPKLFPLHANTKNDKNVNYKAFCVKRKHNKFYSEMYTTWVLSTYKHEKNI